MLACAGAEVDEVVGCAHRLLVVLDDDDGVAEVAQLPERGEQTRVVALVQSDRRLVEDVEHADETRADLRREANALRLAARQRLRGAAEREIVESDVDEEAQPLAHFLEDRAGDLGIESRPAVRRESAMLSKKLSAAVIGISSTSPMLRPATVTASDSGLRRRPPHVVHGTASMYSSSSMRTVSDSVSS